MPRVLLLHGPNLNRLGLREPAIYGSTTLEALNEGLVEKGAQLGLTVTARQSNHEGILIDWLHEAETKAEAVIMNPGAYTHYSYALRDAVASITCPTIEVHISNIHQRETFRHTSVIAPVTRGQIVGFGVYGYELALYAVAHQLQKG